MAVFPQDEPSQIIIGTYVNVCKLRGGTGAATSDDADDDLYATSDNEKDDLQDDSEELLDASQMPDDYFFTGMIAFFLWGFIVESPEHEVYRSKQFQISDSSREERRLNSRKAIKKEAAKMSSMQRGDAGTTAAGALVGSPFRRGGSSLSQQIEIAKLHTARTIEERRSVDSQYSTRLANIQMEIDNKLFTMAQLWKVTDRNDSIFDKVQQLMQRKQELAESFENSKSQLDYKRRQTDAMLDEAFGSRIARRGRTSLTDNTAGDDISSTAMTHASSNLPTSFVDVPRSQQQTREAVMQSPDNDIIPCS
ncbi:hypothetical protein MHU86_14812 [Fragilaria crotonensis]|nr:hypothetical protein MHU86_14812 [Fragilaria crotonensis]